MQETIIFLKAKKEESYIICIIINYQVSAIA